MNRVPTDPFMLLSFINMHLRDDNENFDSLCRRLDLDKESILRKLYKAGFEYMADINQFR